MTLTSLTRLHTDDVQTRQPNMQQIAPNKTPLLEEDQGQKNDFDHDDDFSFVCMNPNGSPVSADDAFVNGQIRPQFPVFDQRRNDVASKQLLHQLKKLIIEESEDSTRFAGEASTPELRKKSYSTGFSKLRRFRDVIRRSNSDGKDAFVFVRNAPAAEKKEKCRKTDVAGVKEKKPAKGETASSFHELHYTRNRAENEKNKRKSYLPYRKNLMGFFTSVNGLSRNLHPF